jgi:threonine dehydrogenase-like Zn-dependent dehydrogenase
VAVGERVTEVPVGASVAVEICIGCGICRHCKVGRVNLCEKLEELGVTVDGGMTEFVAVPARNIHVLPPGLAHEAAVFADPLACVIRGLEMLTVTSGSWVAVLGPGRWGCSRPRSSSASCGPGGRHRDPGRPSGDRPEHGRRRGRERAGRDPVAAVREITDGGADFVYEAAGSAEALSQGIGMARKGGSVVMLTVHKRVEVDLEPAIRGELHLVGAICYSYREYQRALGLLAQGRVDVEPLARHVFPLDQAQEAFEFVLSRQGVKAILSVAGERDAGRRAQAVMAFGPRRRKANGRRCSDPV